MAPLKYREKRRFPRVSVEFDLIYKLNSPPQIVMKIEDQERHASLLSISESGMAIQSDQQIPEATELEMLFHLIFKDRQTPPMYAVGQVRYNNLLPGSKGYRIGIQFINIDEADRKTIADFVHSIPPIQAP